jgi:hypothetical protein
MGFAALNLSYTGTLPPFVPAQAGIQGPRPPNKKISTGSPPSRGRTAKRLSFYFTKLIRRQRQYVARMSGAICGKNRKE